MNLKLAKRSRVGCIAGCLAWGSRLAGGTAIWAGPFAVSGALGTDLPMPGSALTSVSEVHQLVEREQRVQCAVRLEGIVLWASAARDQFVLRDDSGVAFLQTDLHGQTLQTGQRLVLAGNCVAEEDRLILGNQPVVDNDGLHTMTEKSGKVFLQAGKHQIHLSWFNHEMPSGLEVYYQGPNLPRQPVPDAALFHTETVPDGGSVRWLNGLNYQCYEGEWVRVPTPQPGELTKQGIAANFDINLASRPPNVGLVFSGYIAVPRDGTYTFTTISDDGSLLFIDEQVPQLQISGTNGLPAPVAIAPRQLLRQDQENRWSQAEGTITFVSKGDGALDLDLRSATGTMHLDVADGQDGSSGFFLNSRVRATGICQSTFTADGQRVAGRLLVPSLKEIEILQPNPALWSECPTISNTWLRATNFLDASNAVVRVEGKIHSFQPGKSLLVEDATGQVLVETTQPEQGHVGSAVEALGLWTNAGTNLVLRCGFYRELPRLEDALPLLTTIQEVKGLNRSQADLDYPVKIRGIITAPLVGGFFIQDAGSAIYVQTGDMPLSDVPRAGDYWEIQGTTSDYFAPIIQATQAVRLGPGVMPEPLQPAWDQLINGSLDTRYVEIQGVVVATKADGMLMLTHDGEVTVGLYDVPPADWKQYENALISVRGCLVPDHNLLNQQVTLGHLRLSNCSVSVVKPAPADPFSTPLKRISDLLLFDPHANHLQRTRVAGQILGEQDGEFFLQEGTDGLRFIPRTPIHLRVGDIVQVVGYPDLGGPSPALREALVRCTGHAALPSPQPLPTTSLSSDYQAVLNGGDWVDRAPATVMLTGLTVGHSYAVQLWVDESRASVGRNETVASGSNDVTLNYNSTGTSGGLGQYTIATFTATNTSQTFTLTGNTSSQLNAIQLRDVTGYSRVTTDVSFAAASTIAGDSDVSTNGTLVDAYDLSGTTATVNGVVFTGSTSTDALGAHILLSGFAGGNYTGFGADAAPFGSLLDHYDATLVRVQARLVSLSSNPSGKFLILHTGKQGFVARLGTWDGFRANLLPGSRLELTGVYASQGNGTATAGGTASFELLLNSPAEIAVLEQPSWWTLQRLLAVLGALVAVLIGALLWIFSLKRQVNAQAAVIRQKAESEATMEERTRIAREIHDTLEQFLAGTNLQLNALAGSLHDMPPESRRTLEMARSMVRHGQEEARRTVRNLRLLALEKHDLPTALNQLIAQFRNGSTPDIQASIKGAPRSLSIQVESYLLRIGQEATTNSVKHARASAIGLELAYGDDMVQLTVRDDGCGFDAAHAASSEAGHFGLLGMRERAEKVGGTLEILTKPGHGTILRVKVPLTPSGAAVARSNSISI